MTEAEQREKERVVQAYIDAHSHVAQPYQDVSCRVRGPILYDLNHNFCQAWEESQPPASLFCDLPRYAWIPPVLAVRAACKVADALHREMDPDFIARRNRLDAGAFDLPYGHHNLQLVRTQPLHAEKTVKECYANLSRQMLHYIFIQNQYVQYGPWASYLLECVDRLRAASYLKPIYVFILTSTPEDKGMDRPTYDVASKVGESQSMRVEHKEAVEKAKKQKTQPPIAPNDLARRGINVFMGSLWTYAEGKEKLTPKDYEEIYIHSKVAIVDDAAFTIGSANLNLRSMAFDSELNVLSEAKDVAYQLRVDLFSQCARDAGPPQFGDMADTFKKWKKLASENMSRKANLSELQSELFPFYVDRQPGMPVV